ncbi:mCG148381 [Mus musculus]|nr:mCG148381 [Mus musculus]
MGDSFSQSKGCIASPLGMWPWSKSLCCHGGPQPLFRHPQQNGKSPKSFQLVEMVPPAGKPT